MSQNIRDVGTIFRHSAANSLLNPPPPPDRGDHLYIQDVSSLQDAASYYRKCYNVMVLGYYVDTRCFVCAFVTTYVWSLDVMQFATFSTDEHVASGFSFVSRIFVTFTHTVT